MTIVNDNVKGFRSRETLHVIKGPVVVLGF